jgi:cytochrome c oxidase accessory protein FixG
MSQLNLDNDDYRNHLYNQSKDGRRLWIYPGRIIGHLYRARTYFSYVLLMLLFGLPWVEISGQPVFMFNVMERTFIFWTVPFYPQDFHLVALGIVSFLIFISLFTVLFGRIWCGWACPQTIFMEMLFRKVEYWIEGDDKAQRRLDEGPWNQEKILKKTSKHFLFLILAFAISNTFLMYIIGKNEWLKLVIEPPKNHLIGFMAIWIFTAIFYFVFARFREIVCMVVCPYGRLQGVLLDNNSILVQYDHKRGEPRGKMMKDEFSTAQGDCIDCHWCVRVCPTGIDIRNGSNQLECIGCTSCIDACDEVMEKINKPKNLIRYDSLNGVNKEAKLKFTNRIAAYSFLLISILGVFGYLLMSRKNHETTLLRMPGMTYQYDEKTKSVSNLYQIEILNKSKSTQNYRISVKPPMALIWVGKGITSIDQGKMAKGEFFIKGLIGQHPRHEKLPIMVTDSEGDTEIIKTSFIQPDEY